MTLIHEKKVKGYNNIVDQMEDHTLEFQRKDSKNKQVRVMVEETEKEQNMDIHFTLQFATQKSNTLYFGAFILDGEMLNTIQNNDNSVWQRKGLEEKKERKNMFIFTVQLVLGPTKVAFQLVQFSTVCLMKRKEKKMMKWNCAVSSESQQKKNKAQSHRFSCSCDFQLSNGFDIKFSC